MLPLGAGFGIVETGDAEARDSVDATATDSVSRLLDMRVHGQGNAKSSNSNNTSFDIGQMPREVRDMLQTISVVPKELIVQQRLFTLDNVPGIMMSTGNGGLNGDQFCIRSQQARSDIYEDGRDVSHAS
ncbi:hypothetical protein [Gluconobacter kanchanaburiensis]|uniref:TonB-dependent receptor plug domain-containing protein n=1 Tax=Gluconobacter kanchanaburiensis NBRC 103587 TaxID=1307948 RepID=A0A511B7K0_9PROT|nr:hypothetical protein [Gluconobacter kanchanaburiensis]GBR68528.1 hypothetical protein AA103587_0849 [Gluconobacter kanchanaburiensis NBRC 103587]GEK96378.1 hypothetical protein GKA01_15750 [Gluconobacter kanchanaburiensis NBRC 103587]